MTVTATEALPLKSGDMVRVSEDSPTVSGKVGELDFFSYNASAWLVRPTDGSFADYVATRYLTLVTMTDQKVTDLEAQLVAVSNERDEARTALSLSRTALDTFKDKVRTTLGDSVGDDDNDLFDTFNEVLSSLGLEYLEREFEVEVTFRGSYTVTISGVNADDAASKVGTDDVKEFVAEDPYDNVIDDFSTSAE